MTDVVVRGWRKRTFSQSITRRLPEVVAGSVYGGGVMYAVKEYSSKESFYARLPNTRLADLNERSIDSVVDSCLDGKSGSVALQEGQQESKALSGGRKLLADNRYGAYY